MRGLAALAPFLSALVVCLPNAAGAAAHAPLPKWIEWSSRPIHRAGLTFRTSTRREKDFAAPVLDIAAPDGRTVRVKGEASFVTTPAFLFVERGARPPLVLFRSYTGGAHCCLAYQLVQLAPAGFQVSPLGMWDDGAQPEPERFAADGALVFRARDQRFDYRLASHAGSLLPLAILKLGDDRLEDVSADPDYRPLFVRELAAARQDCEQAQEAGTCLGYVATAARAGRAQAAFAILDRHRPSPGHAPWTVPQSCDAEVSALVCAHEKPTKTFRTLHDAAAWFLTDLGYLPGPQR